MRYVFVSLHSPPIFHAVKILLFSSDENFDALGIYGNHGGRTRLLEAVMVKGRNGQEMPVDGRPRFYQVKEVAVMLRVSEQTIHRAIDADEFPAIRIRNRKIIPAVVIDEMVEAARAGNKAIDPADWVAPKAG